IFKRVGMHASAGDSAGDSRERSTSGKLAGRRKYFSRSHGFSWPMDEQRDRESAFCRWRGHFSGFSYHARRRLGTGTFTYDFAKHEVRVSNIKATVRPVEAAYWIDPDLPKTVAPYKFHQPPAIAANGVYQFRGGTGTKLEINVDAPSGMDYVFLGKTLPF